VSQIEAEERNWGERKRALLRQRQVSLHKNTQFSKFHDTYHLMKLLYSVVITSEKRPLKFIWE
jgi:hypothetical protein